MKEEIIQIFIVIGLNKQDKWKGMVVRKTKHGLEKKPM